MEKIELEAQKRTVTGKKNRLLRAQGEVPAVVYGHATKPQSIQLESKRLERVYRQAGGNRIIALKVDEGRAKNVLIQDLQFDGARGDITHVDFYAVRMDEALTAEVPVHFTGESKAVYQDEGTLVKALEMVAVESLPADLPEYLEADIAVLDDFEKTITLADLKIPAGVKLVEEDLSTVVAKVDPPRSDEEIAELDEAVEGGVPESAQEEDPVVVSEENEGSADR